ncbi:unnamed protein product [Ectocarpus sp. 6 AP-2014]
MAAASSACKVSENFGLSIVGSRLASSLSFTVALSHGHHWAKRRWYISTLELWPSSLQLLQFESTFDYPLSGGLWPDSLVRAKRGHQRSRERDALLTGMLICTQNPGWERMLSFV